MVSTLIDLGVRDDCLTFEGFCAFSRYITKHHGGKPLWTLLRLYGYGETLELEDKTGFLSSLKTKATTILAVARNVNLRVPSYWLYKKALGLDAPVVSMATGLDAEVFGFFSLLSYVFLGVLATLWFVHQTVTLVLTAQSLASNHELLGSLTIVFVILPSIVMAVLWCAVQEGVSNAPRRIFDAIQNSTH